MSPYRSIVLAVVCVLTSHSTGVAGTTGQLNGWVTNDEGEPLPGVSVFASSPSQIGGVQLAQTDAAGWFRYPSLAPGDYSVRIELDGFVTQELTEVQVRLDRTAELRVTLPSALFGGEVVVVETTPVVDPSQVSAGQTFTSEYLQEALIGLENRTYLGALGQAPGVDSGSFGPAALGSGILDNTYLVDGSNATDPYDKGPGLLSVSLEAIDEIAFHTGGFEAQYGRAVGGVVNVITKSGGNSFSGSLDYRLGDSSFSSRGDHHDPDEEPFETRDANASLGGPILRDQLWFFASLQSFSETSTPSGSASSTEWSEQNYLGKLTWQASPSWSLVGRLIANPLDVGPSAGRLIAPEARDEWDWRGHNAHLDLNGIVSEDLLFGLRVGGQEASSEIVPFDGDLTTIGHFNLETGEAYGNYDAQSYDDRELREVEADLTWFVADFGGSHEIKVGASLGDAGYRRNWCRTGSGRVCTAGDEGYLFRDGTNAAGENVPYDLLVERAVGPQEFTGSMWAAYLQDAWRVRSDLTLRLGLRWDRSQQENDLGQEIADLSMLQPRLGLAWDIGGRGRNILRGSWGRYMHPSRLSVAEAVAQSFEPQEFWASCSDFGLTDPEFCGFVADLEGLEYRQDPESWDPAGWLLLGVFLSEPSRTAGGLEPMYADQLLLAFERELYRRTSLELSYFRKDTKDVLEDTCNGNFPTPQIDAECDYGVVANLPGLRENYEALMLRFESRAHDRFHVISSYVYSDSKSSRYFGDASDAFDVWPYHFVNRYGYTDDHRRHEIKLNGFVVLPLDFFLALGGTWYSEFRWTPQSRPPSLWGTEYLEPRGSREGPGLSQLDLQAGKAFDWGRARLKILAAVHNVLDSEAVTQVCEIESGCGSIEMGEAERWQLPRRYELGVRVEF